MDWWPVRVRARSPDWQVGSVLVPRVLQVQPLQVPRAPQVQPVQVQLVLRALRAATQWVLAQPGRSAVIAPLGSIELDSEAPRRKA
jgi:hypothetical protein